MLNPFNTPIAIITLDHIVKAIVATKVKLVKMFDRKPVRYKCVKHFTQTVIPGIFFVFYWRVAVGICAALFVNNHFFVVVMVFNVLKISSIIHTTG